MVIVTLNTKEPDDEVVTEFDEATRLARLAESDKNLDIATAREQILAEDGKTVTG
jgi:sodium/proline symporter